MDPCKKKKKTSTTVTVKYQFSVLKMAEKFNYLIEGEGSEKIYISAMRRERGKREAFRKLSSRINSPITQNITLLV